jgi:glycine/D-amino acid oxidase-like deaminating enzyme
MLGPMPDHAGLWLATGFNVGIGTGGGSAEFLAHWMTKGKPPFDLGTVHADRFDSHMSTEAALDAIRKVYAVGYELPDFI